MRRNQNRDLAENARVQHAQIAIFKANGIPVEGISIMAVFGCNFAGDIPVATVHRPACRRATTSLRRMISR